MTHLNYFVYVNWFKTWVLFLRTVILASVFLLYSPHNSAETVHEEHISGYETELVQIIKSVQEGNLESSLSLVDQHLVAYPDSRVGYLIKADLLLAMSSELKKVGEQAPDTSKMLEGLMHQISNRLQHNINHSKKSDDLFPDSLIDMGRHKHVLVADMPGGRLYLYRNEADGPILIRDYYISLGSEGYGKQLEGDNKTPIGVYSIYKYIDPRVLPDLYGDGAFPVDYPNRIDKYRNRTGYGIWLHGTPSNTYARSPFASEGCFVLSNEDLNDIAQFIDVDTHTPVILSDAVNWVRKDQLLSEKDNYLAILKAWKADWESLNTSAYLAHYSNENFNLGRDNYKRWSRAKESTNARKTFIQIDLEIDSLFLYPGEQDMFVVSYTQRYLSNNFHSESNKEQYWQKDKNGQWRIIYEG